MSIGKALLGVQAEAPALQKNAINPYFKSKYLSLDALMDQILPLLNKHGIVLTQSPTMINEPGAVGWRSVPGLRTTLWHPDSDTKIEDLMLLAIDPEQITPQSQGSAITYARRYSLMAMLGLVADEDTDGAVKAKQPKAKAPVLEPGESIVDPNGELFPDQREPAPGQFSPPPGATDPAPDLSRARKAMWAEFRRAVAEGEDEEQLKTEILAQYGVRSTKQLTLEELNLVIAGLKLRVAK